MKKSHALSRVLQLVCLLLVSLPFQASAQVYIISCFEYQPGSQFKVVLSKPDYIQDLPKVTGTNNQDCIVVGSVDYSAEQVLNIGSQNQGVGAGKVTFNPMNIKKAVDKLSPQLFAMMASGNFFKSVNLFFFKPYDKTEVGVTAFLTIRLGLVGIKSMTTSVQSGEDNVDNAENLVLEYGEIKITPYKFDSTGNRTALSGSGWNRVKNTSNFDNISGDLNPL